MKLSSNLKALLYVLIIFAIFTNTLSYAQVNQTSADSSLTLMESIHLEKPDSNRFKVLGKSLLTASGYTYSTNEVYTTQVNVDSDGMDILYDAANEPSIAINPTNPDEMVIGWRQFDDIRDSFRQAGNAYTTDGGVTWNYSEPIESGFFRSDPVLDYDSQGNIYYNSLSQDENYDFQCHIFVSEDGGATWDQKLYANGGDKQWMTIDKSSGKSNGHIYEMWTFAYGICNPASFVRSVNKGQSFEPCLEVPELLYWGTLCVNRTGDLYIAGVNTLYWSEDNTTFVVAKSSTAKDSTSLVTWDYSTRVNLDGELGYGFGDTTVAPNPSIMGQAWIAADTSGGEFDGNVYLLTSVKRASVNDPLDVMFSRSTDEGKSWCDPIRVNDDLNLHAWQWFSTISVAPNGRIDAAWLDTRDDPDSSYMSALYYAYSTDAGDTWSPNVRLSELFNPHLGWPSQNKMGDYFHLISYEDGAYLAWANTLNGGQDVYFSRITVPAVGVKENFIPVTIGDYKLYQNYPNPFNPVTMINYKIPEKSNVLIKVYSNLGEEIGVILDEVKERGIHAVSYDASGLASGVYYYTLYANKYKETHKMIVLQ